MDNLKIEQGKAVLQKVKHTITILPGIPLLGVYPGELKGAGTKTHTRMFRAVLLTVAKRWKQPRCSSADDGHTKCGPSTQWVVFGHKE